MLRRAGLGGDGLGTGGIAARFTHPRGVLQLPGGALEAKIKALLLQIEDGVIHLIGAHCADIGGFPLGHDHLPPSAMPAAKPLLIGRFAAASDTPSLSVCPRTPPGP